MSIIIQVTQEDISEGIKNDCYSCAIARAINRHLGPDYQADVAGRYSGVLAITYGDRRICQWMQHMQHIAATLIPWINAWDKGEPVQPFSFRLDIPDRLLAAPTT